MSCYSLYSEEEPQYQKPFSGTSSSQGQHVMPPFPAHSGAGPQPSLALPGTAGSHPSLQAVRCTVPARGCETRTVRRRFGIPPGEHTKDLPSLLSKRRCKPCASKDGCHPTLSPEHDKLIEQDQGEERQRKGVAAPIFQGQVWSSAAADGLPLNNAQTSPSRVSFRALTRHQPITSLGSS